MEKTTIPRIGSQRRIYIVDSDISDLENAARVLYREEYSIGTFQFGQDVIRQLYADTPCCMVCDTSLPDLTATRLLDVLSGIRQYVAVVFTGINPPASLIVDVMKRGASDFVLKPFSDDVLLSAVCDALKKHATIAAAQDAYQRIQTRYRTLTSREQEIVKFVVTGMLNKQVAIELGISEKTVKIHRARVMKKLGIQSVTELVRLHDHLASFEQTWFSNFNPGQKWKIVPSSLTY